MNCNEIVEEMQDKQKSQHYSNKSQPGVFPVTPIPASSFPAPFPLSEVPGKALKVNFKLSCKKTILF